MVVPFGWCWTLTWKMVKNLWKMVAKDFQRIYVYAYVYIYIFVLPHPPFFLSLLLIHVQTCAKHLSAHQTTFLTGHESSFMKGTLEAQWHVNWPFGWKSLPYQEQWNFLSIFIKDSLLKNEGILVVTDILRWYTSHVTSGAWMMC